MNEANTDEEIKTDKLKEWNRNAVKLSPRAEKLKNPQDVFTETIFFEKLKSDRNSIVLGRRGTGKTLLLKMAEWEYTTKFEEVKKIPAYINGSQLRNDAQLIGDTPESIALSLYVEFIKCVIKKLNDFINIKTEKKFWDKIFTTNNSSKLVDLKTIASQLYELLARGDVRYLPSGNASQEIQTLDKAGGKAEADVSFSFSNPKNLGWKLNLDGKASKQLEKNGISTRNIQGNIILPLTTISNKIDNILELIDGSSLVVLFDEWSDVTPDIRAQPILADMIKRTFSPNMAISLKLACIPNRTRLSTRVPDDNPIPTGFEIGDDFFRDVDLDSVVFTENDIGQIMPFFLMVLKNHMSSKISWVDKMTYQTFEKFLFKNIFADEHTFSELCHASAANPRDFITLFIAASTRQINGNYRQIQLAHIRDAACDLYEDKSEAFIAGSEEMKFLQFVFRTCFAQQNSYYFFVPEEAKDDLLVRNLWVERLIHRIPFDHYDLKTFMKYPRYQIDYSKCVHLLKADAASRAREEGRRIAAYIKDALPDNWIGEIVGSLAAAGLPMVKAWTAARKAISEKEAGKKILHVTN